MPGKRGFNDRLEVGTARTPAKLLDGQTGVGNQDRGVTRAPGNLTPRNWAPAYRFGCGDHLAH